MLGVHRFGAASPAAANRGRVVPTNTLGSSARGATSRALDCRPDAAGAVHCFSPGAFETVEVARDGTPIEPEHAAARSKPAKSDASARPITRSAVDGDDANPRELLRRDELLRRLACVPDAATGALRCVTPGAFPVVEVAPDGSPIAHHHKPTRRSSETSETSETRRRRSRATEPVERLGAARDEKKSAHPAAKGAAKGAAARASCRPGVDGSMRCTTPGAFPAVNPDALDVPAKTSDDSTASTGKARRDDASSDSEKKASEKKASSSSDKKASKKKVDDAKNKNDENAEKTKADVPEEESDPDAQMLQETDAVTVDEMAGERRERHPAAYQVVDASYEARREKEREEAAIAEREAKLEESYGDEDASVLAESEIKSWEKSATTEITPDRMAQFKEMEMEGAEEPMDGEVDEVPKRLHEPKLFCAPDADGKMKCTHSLVAAAQ